MSKKQKRALIRIIVSAVLTVAFALLPVKGYIKILLFAVPYLVIGYDILYKAFLGIIHGQPFDENFLMAVATVGAAVLGKYTEAVSVMIFYQTGELFQSYAVGKSRKNISELMDIRPDCANVETADGKTEKCDPDEVSVGSVIVVAPGEKIPIDGVVISGSTTVDTSALTGESLPRSVETGGEVLGGTVNLSGVIRVKTTKEFGESTVSKILDLIENASSKKSKSEHFISKFAKIYTPAVCLSAVLLAFVPPLVSWGLLGGTADFAKWIYRALTFLVISCPCALVISIPLTFFAGIGGAGKEGILVKGSNYMETLSNVKTVVFDKTGTLTKGVFEVAGVHHNVCKPEKLIEYAALAESYSTHPIATGLKKAYGKAIDASRVSDVKEIGGQGVTAKVDGVSVAVGNEKLMKAMGAEYHICHSVGTVVHICIDGKYGGHILICDVVKTGSASAIENLRKEGVTRTVMLTGDRKEAAEAVAAELGIDSVYSELLPTDKVDIAEKLLSDLGKDEKLAFVGDGINDSPVLSRADVGIAMGSLGSDAAIEAADVVLMDDDPRKICTAVAISRKCMRIVRENIGIALGIKLLCLVLGALGIADMWLAIFSDVGVMIIAVLNAIRALKIKKRG